jgi:hypothetical protein
MMEELIITTDLPDVLLEISNCVGRAEGVTEDSISWGIYVEFESDDAAWCAIKINDKRVANITVHKTRELKIEDEAQCICAALVWSGIRSVRLKKQSLPQRKG